MTRITHHMFQVLATSATFLLMAATVHAAPVSGDLIKGSTDSVYYYGGDGKRYVFPTEKTYKTWYADFSSVRSVSDAELGAIMIGGNATYKPGVKMVKITTDPKVYAVAANGTLRWVMTESVARDLYGTDWNTKIDDVPDAFFINYRIGAPVASASDFRPSTETAAATSINTDRGLVTPTPLPIPPPPAATSTPPTPTPSPYSGTLDLSRTSAPTNQPVNLLGTASRQSEVTAVTLFFDGVFYKRCEYSPCSTDVNMIGTKPTVDAVAKFEWIMGQIAFATSTVTLQSGGVPGISITITRPEVRPGNSREVVIDADNRFIAKTIDIFLDGNNVRGCTDIQQCRYTGAETSVIGTVHTVYAILRDTNGNAQQTETKTITVVENERPLISVATGKNTIFVGEQVDTTVQATDDSGIAWTEIWVDGAVVKHCAAASCTTNVGPWSSARTVYVVGKASDMSGFIGYGTSTAVVVQ